MSEGGQGANGEGNGDGTGDMDVGGEYMGKDVETREGTKNEDWSGNKYKNGDENKNGNGEGGRREVGNVPYQERTRVKRQVLPFCMRRHLCRHDVALAGSH